MKVTFLLAMARQVEGDNMLIDIKYAHTDPAKVREWYWQNQNDLPNAQEIGGMQCVIIYGIHSDIEVATD